MSLVSASVITHQRNLKEVDLLFSNYQNIEAVHEIAYMLAGVRLHTPSKTPH